MCVLIGRGFPGKYLPDCAKSLHCIYKIAQKRLVEFATYQVCFELASPRDYVESRVSTGRNQMKKWFLAKAQQTNWPKPK